MKKNTTKKKTKEKKNFKEQHRFGYHDWSGMLEEGELDKYDIDVLFSEGLLCKAVTVNSVRYFLNPDVFPDIEKNPTLILMFMGVRHCTHTMHCKYRTLDKVPNEYCYGCKYLSPVTKEQFERMEQIKVTTDKFIPYCPFIDGVEEEVEEEKPLFSSYRSYLYSPHWRKFRLKAIEHYGNVCSWCGANDEKIKMNVHHISYDNLGNETFEDVILLCPTCHSKAHGKYKK